MTYPPPPGSGPGYGPPPGGGYSTGPPPGYGQVPPPGYGPVPGVYTAPRIASVGSRFGALLIDVLITVGALLVAIGIATLLGAVNEVLGVIGGLLAVVVYVAVVFGLPIYTEGGPAARTIGKNLMGLRVVRVDGTPMTYGMAAGRTLSKLFLSGFLYLGYLWAVFNDDRRTWHDHIAGTGVVEAPKQPLRELFRR